MHRNVTILIIILTVILIAGYLVWLRGRFQATTVVPTPTPIPTVLTPTFTPTPTVEASPSVSPSATISPKAKRSPTPTEPQTTGSGRIIP
ncbi:MAG: hypothetical protein UU29_C0009G0087 [Candidatus Daviesbacteria bacterium GW2011_GWA2_40_9]|uniref:Uncharacterized protein n=1 Tax=Candidatus Daviesbacteria bacterium GW2011_GWA2_40_9 TaxID=1618424 RepID=A0A0G0U6J0_9BACT|nr:MAG: hypothetical protein UU29_C0009G0087 [Candidatus Daviesbacteria bacterium GW2011_GWA2_40_9]